MNTCGSCLQAVDHANTHYSNGYKATSIDAVVCARHGLVQKIGIVDLQKGERYVNMDYIILAMLRNVQFARLLVIYCMTLSMEQASFLTNAGLPTGNVSTDYSMKHRVCYTKRAHQVPW